MKINRFEMDMCSGPLLKKLIIYALPLMATGMIQLLFSAVDLAVVGQFNGSQALAAVGATTTLTIMLTNLFFGVTIGANVLVARYFASDDDDRLARTVQTALPTGLICGILALVICAPLAQQALVWMGTPDDIIDQSSLYLKIFFCGMPFFFVYHFGAAVLRGIGDTRRPLLFLSIAGVTNILLNLFMVIVLGLGVAGVAIATVVAQCISCALVVITLIKTAGAYRFDPKKFLIDPDILLLMLRIGIPAGIQSFLINFSNVLIQSSVNSFGSDAVAGYAAAGNLNGFLYMAVNAVTQSCLTFVSQNYGAKNLHRIDRTVITCAGMEAVTGTVLGGLVFVFGRQLISLYNSEPAVIECGMQCVLVVCMPYALCGIMDMLPGAIRGLGYSSVPMFITLAGVCFFRVFWIYQVFPHHRTLMNLFMSFPASWVVTISMQLVCFFIVRRLAIRKLAS